MVWPLKLYKINLNFTVCYDIYMLCYDIELWYVYTYQITTHNYSKLITKQITMHRRQQFNIIMNRVESLIHFI